jgi:hypothetical protein
VLDDGSIYIIMKNKEGKFVCVGDLYLAEKPELNKTQALDN